MSRKPIEIAKEGAHLLIQHLEAALDRGEIDEAQWYREIAAVITPQYLAADNPRAQSGHSGDEAHWTQARSLIADAIDRDGTFLDVGCANGHLMECMVEWVRTRGFAIEPHGLDISPELIELARCRLPHWVDRIYVGNAIDWDPPQQFDFVRAGLYGPRRRQKDLVDRLLRDVVAPGGRLILGTRNEERGEPAGQSTEARIRSWGFEIAGTSERPHYHDDRLVYRVLWIDATE